jgi:16S rRNA (guanine966-N2)-methyltransferase
MTRIIAGFAGSLRLAVPASGTRPTSDRVREAIFSALSARDAIEDATILDLYAGSGALGLEAASRGAGRVTLVESARPAAALCRSNAAKVLAAAPPDARPAIEVSGQAVQVFLTGRTAPESGLHPGIAGWDLVFIDPPYNLGGPELRKTLDALVPLLTPDAIVVLERRTRTAVPELPVGLELERRKEYGDTMLYWLAAAE